VSFVAEDERYYLRDIEKTIDMEVDVLKAPEGSKVDLLPTPDPNERLYKPKGPSRGNGGRGNGGGRGGQRRPQGKAKPQGGAGKSGGKQGGRSRGGKKRNLESARG
jgi:ATP-dependent RNA helicase RhlE